MATILGRDRNEGQHFQEIADAVSALTTRPVFFMAHAHPAPPGGVLYHWENHPLVYPQNLASAKEVWDFSKRNIEKYPTSIKALHVPCGYHPTMERFRPASSTPYDVAWMGCVNERRHHVLSALRRNGLSIVEIGCFGSDRDAYIAQCKVVLNMRFYENGVFPVLRSAHAAANCMPCVAEVSPEIPDWVSYRCTYDQMIDRTVALIRSPTERHRIAVETYERFRRTPLILPP